MTFGGWWDSVPLSQQGLQHWRVTPPLCPCHPWPYSWAPQTSDPVFVQHLTNTQTVVKQ